MQNSDLNPPHNTNMGVNYQRSTTPILLQNDAQLFSQTINHHTPAAIRGDWSMAPPGYSLDTSIYPQPTYETYGIPFQTTSPIDYLPAPTGLNDNVEVNLDASLLDDSYLNLPPQMSGGMPFNWHDFPNDLLSGFNPSLTHGAPDLLASQQTFSEGSPSDNYLEVRSLTSSSSDNGWAAIDYVPTQVETLFNPEQTLHPRTLSDSSLSDMEHLPRNSWESYVEVPNAATSPETDSAGESEFYHVHSHSYDLERPSPPAAVTTAIVQPIAIRRTSSPHRSPTSPIARRQSRKSSVMKAAKPIARRTSQNTRNDSEKRVGRRRGPLKPDQRRQAGEIRKLGACLRCRFLKKTVRHLAMQ